VKNLHLIVQSCEQAISNKEKLFTKLTGIELVKRTNKVQDPKLIVNSVGTGADPGFNAQERTNKALTTGPFGNTCEADEVSPEVEAGVVARLRCLQP
jgi:hypothetical protein